MLAGNNKSFSSYTFTSLGSDSNELVTLTYSFDSLGNVSISKSVSIADSNDHSKVGFACQQCTFNRTQSNDTGFVTTIIDDPTFDLFWIDIDLDNPPYVVDDDRDVIQTCFSSGCDPGVYCEITWVWTIPGKRGQTGCTNPCRYCLLIHQYVPKGGSGVVSPAVGGLYIVAKSVTYE
jgi:hypothetical protein